MKQQSFINLRFEQIEKRFNEIDILLNLAANSRKNLETYQALCRSAHVLLVAHFEGLYKEICRDVIDDLNLNTNFDELKKHIFHTHCEYFMNNKESDKVASDIRIKLKEAFQQYPSKIKIDPFLFVDNKNPAPQILETILERFGVKNFFWKIHGSDLDIVFEDQIKTTTKLRDRLSHYVKKNTFQYPYTVDPSCYNPTPKHDIKKSKTLWEDFLNNFLKERHNIIHGNTTGNSNDNESLYRARLKIEILVYTFIINICSAANPLFKL